MKTITLSIVLLLFSFGLIGCGSEMATGAAIGGGVSELLRETIKGGEADIARKKAEVIATYNKGVETGASIEELDELRGKVDDWVLVEKGADITKKFLGMDFSKPETVGLASASLFELALLYFGGKKLATTAKKYSAEKKGIAKALTLNDGTVTAPQVYDSIAMERKVLKLPVG